ncbi:ComEC/Rec2 family competence protein [Nocardioides sp. MAH-18]|uniref:ComEC/Rec2 family competence protein n=2 Tax=Nocardioidaceae TaxID=85015 RepID=A0A6L6XPW8_9ACTN|nr:ComEC/Rec2 family competence protein [Nocardioides sp. MAH-18]MBA2956518.1 ComEC/Rec2 family competence protein [Nocardioides sp. CGMCC 1.13656]MVQ47665.1 ComEC/Rec2 family competence protein [Nocardioides sp. MAH-18]
MLGLAVAAWAGAGAGRWQGWWSVGGALVLAAVLGLALRRRSGSGLGAALAGVLVLAAVGGVTVLRLEQVRRGPVAALAVERAAVRVEGVVVSDPREVQGRFGSTVVCRLEVRSLTGRAQTFATRTTVLVVGDTAWLEAPLGSRVRTTGRLGPADDDVAGVLASRGPPEAVAGPDPWWRAASAVRASVRAAVAHRPADQAALVPALVDGDDAGLDEQLAADFRTTGLTHLLAVSGTNLTLVVGFLLLLARTCGVRGRWLYVVGALGIVGFVLLARTEPSVLRAAVMGAVGLVGLGVDGRRRGPRALGVAVVVLLLVQPGLAVQPGFALSALATGGIVLLAPVWRDALARWLPRVAAEAVAVPAAAQLACTPVVAALSGQVSLVAVAANLAVAPAVAPATVLGLGGGLVGLVWAPAGRLLGTLAGWCVAWIVAVATRAADLPGAAVGWGSGALALAVLTLLVAAVAVAGPVLLRHPVTGVGCCLLLGLVVAVRPPQPGWPPRGWVMVACDVGQGDALVLAADGGAGVVVDAGPDPVALDRCLDRLGVRTVPLAVLTHFHADHVDGFAALFEGRAVGAVETTSLQDPPEAVQAVSEIAAAHGVTPTVAPYAVPQQVGDLRLTVLWPPPGAPETGPGDGSTANDASVVLLAEVRGVRLLLTGDVEPHGQAALARTWPDLRVDVLKVPHHGSRYQDEPWLLGLGARVALVSVGADNDYGHPAAEALGPLVAAGTRVLRTDTGGDLAVVVDGTSLATVTVGGL